MVTRLKRTLQTLTEASNELEEAVPFFAQTSVRNLIHIAEQPSIAPLRGALAGLPAVVVSAGPSLDRNIAQLRGREGQVVIIAINQTVRALRKAGVRADLVVVVDPMKVTYHFEGVGPDELGTLLLGASVDPSLFDLPAETSSASPPRPCRRAGSTSCAGRTPRPAAEGRWPPRPSSWRPGWAARPSSPSAATWPSMASATTPTPAPTGATRSS